MLYQAFISLPETDIKIANVSFVSSAEVNLSAEGGTPPRPVISSKKKTNFSCKINAQKGLMTSCKLRERKRNIEDYVIA